MTTMANRRRIHPVMEESAPNFSKWSSSSRTKKIKPSRLQPLAIVVSVVLGLLLAPFILLRYGLSHQTLHTKQQSHSEPLRQEQIMRNPLDDTTYHVVFSTDCTDYQNWQSYVFFFHSAKIGQPGTITRIASGCSAKQEKELEDFHYHRIETMSGRFKIHFTPSYVNIDGSPFQYFNKPFGLRHWMEHVLGFPTRQDDNDAIIILLDPDMILVRPLTRHFNTTDKWKDSNIHSFTVDHGKPAAQQYLLGVDWLTWNLANIAGTDSPALKVTTAEAYAHYLVGPPYLATAKDMYEIAVHWTDFAPATKAAFPDMLAEMMAYIVAIAHLQLPHMLSNSFMLSDTRVQYSEPWDSVENEPRESLCTKDYAGVQPNVLHYCQPYSFQGFEYYKGKLRNKMNKCSHPLLEEPPLAITEGMNWSSPHESLKFRRPEKHNEWAVRMNQREAFMTCQLIFKVNDAMEHHRTHSCRHAGNTSKTFRLADS